MRSVSEGFARAMDETIRPMTRFRATVDLESRRIREEAVFTASSRQSYSAGMPDENQKTDCVTFERDFFRLGGALVIAPDSGEAPSAPFLTAAVTNSNGKFASPVRLTIAIENPRTFDSIAWKFLDCWPAEMRLTAYLSGNTVYENTVYPQGLTFKDNSDIPMFDTLVVVIPALSKAGRRLRIAQLVFGGQMVLETGDILDLTQEMFVDPVAASLPTNTLSMRVANWDKRYNPDNPTGDWLRFEYGQRVKVEYGTEANGRIEYVDAATLYLTDAPRVDETAATFEAVDRLSTLKEECGIGVWRASGASLAQLAREVFADAGVTEYVIDPSLETIFSTAVLPKRPHRELLQLIANAACCPIWEDANGRIRIAPFNAASVTLTSQDCAPWIAAPVNGADKDAVTFEKDRWRVGSGVIAGAAQNYLFASNQISGGSLSFPSPVRLTLTRTAPMPAGRAEITFDTEQGEYARDFEIAFYKGFQQIQTEVFLDNRAVTCKVYGLVYDFDRVVVTIRNWSKAGRRARITDFHMTAENEYYLDYTRAITKPRIERSDELKNVVVTVHQPRLAAERVPLTTIAGSMDGDEEIGITYSACSAPQVTCEGATILSSALYAAAGKVRLRGSGEYTLTVTGLPVEDVTREAVTVSGRVGTDCPLDNPLITDFARGLAVGRWIADYHKNRSVYEAEWRQDFRVEAGDSIFLRSNFEERIPARVTRLSYSLPGQSGSIRVRRMV